MHTFTIQSKFTFGDRVYFDSPTQGCRGTGKIFAIVIDAHGYLDYMIEQDDRPEIQPGIQESEIALLTSEVPGAGSGETDDAAQK
jgi:hypothetical protein